MGQKIQITESDIHWMVGKVQQRLNEWNHDDEDFSPDADSENTIDVAGLAMTAAYEYYMKNPREFMEFVNEFYPEGNEFINEDYEGTVNDAVSESDAFSQFPKAEVVISGYDLDNYGTSDTSEIAYSNVDAEMKENKEYLSQINVPEELKQNIIVIWDEAVRYPERAGEITRF